MLDRDDLTGTICALRHHHGEVARLSVRVDARHNVSRHHDRDDLTYHLMQRECAIRTLGDFLDTGICPPFTPAADREAQIDAFLNPRRAAIAAE